MSKFNTLLEETLEAWTDVRLGLIAEVENISSGQFDFRPMPDVKNVHQLVVHILEVAMMLTGELASDSDGFHGKSFRKLLEKHAAPAYAAKTKKDLVRLLKSQFKDAEKRFREAGELHMLGLIARFDGEKGTRLAWLHHGIEQEMYHRGQLTLYQRLMGQEPALTKQIRGG